MSNENSSLLAAPSTLAPSTTVSNTAGPSTTTWIILGGGGALLFTLVVFATIFWRRLQQARMDQTDYMDPTPACSQRYQPPSRNACRPSGATTLFSSGGDTTTTHGRSSTSAALLRPSHGASLSTDADHFDLSSLQMHRIPATELEFVQPLAAGAYGEVLLATFQGTPVAVKRLLLHKSQHADDVAKFIFEIKLLAASVDCPYIVAFVGASWTRPADIMLVMEWMDAGDLRQCLAHMSSTELPWSVKTRVAHDVVHALVYLHSMKLLHRDLKSRNVLLNTAMAAKVTDFGVAKERMDDVESLTVGVGTYRWMAPEVLVDGHYDTSADMYSFGVVLAELSTHRMPYDDVVTDRGAPIPAMALMAKVMRGEVAPTFDRACPAWVSALGRRCLALDPAARPTAMEAAYAIKRELKDVGVKPEEAEL
ncbi:Aste57867_24927 [Aphanomyces stellatus]|uniref:Aste57867_24927 protein n=1 Tax=Aphanomyces stellatus TaxID=120398 RepID=A0A485LRT1_9STRA|nr:hypothetical protein As57867_024849 [Aphanomyces stellatus]VFU01559.1 Aste57867_24927 [Aphanomyces stellatus]